MMLFHNSFRLAIDDLRVKLSKVLEKLTGEIVQSVTGWNFIIEAVSTINI